MKGNFNLAYLEEMLKKAVRVSVSFVVVGVRNEAGAGKGSKASARCSIFDQPFLCVRAAGSVESFSFQLVEAFLVTTVLSREFTRSFLIIQFQR